MESKGSAGFLLLVFPAAESCIAGVGLDAGALDCFGVGAIDRKIPGAAMVE